MADFELVGNVDPFLLVSMRQGEKVYAESNAMVTMETTLELKGRVRGGLLRALARKFANDESFFQQSIEATSGGGQVVLAPELPGEIQVLDIGERQYRIADGAFLAATDGVDIRSKSQGVGNALFAGTGGFFVMQTAGTGKVAVSGVGSVFALDVTDGVDTVVDNGHVVAWDSRLDYRLSFSTAKSGVLGNLVNSQTTGEGLVLKFSGNGKVYVCSRNKGGFLGWIFANAPRKG